MVLRKFNHAVPKPMSPHVYVCPVVCSDLWPSKARKFHPETKLLLLESCHQSNPDSQHSLGPLSELTRPLHCRPASALGLKAAFEGTW